MFVYGLPIISREWIRVNLVKNTNDNRKAIYFLVSIVLFICEINVFVISRSMFNISTAIKTSLSMLLPILIKNIVFTYVAKYTNMLPGVIYSFSMKLFIWIIPIYPNIPWIISTIFDCAILICLYLYFQYTVQAQLRLLTKNTLKDVNPKKIVIFISIAVMTLWFFTGTLYYAPYSIYSQSMYPNIQKGDIVIIEKCSIDEIKEKDIIEYQDGNKIIVHRVERIEYNKKGEKIYITKGDNNNGIDDINVTKNMIIGKVIYKVPYLGWPSILINTRKGG